MKKILSSGAFYVIVQLAALLFMILLVSHTRCRHKQKEKIPTTTYEIGEDGTVKRNDTVIGKAKVDIYIDSAHYSNH